MVHGNPFTFFSIPRDPKGASYFQDMPLSSKLDVKLEGDEALFFIRICLISVGEFCEPPDQASAE